MSNHNLDSVLEIPAPEFIVFRARTAGPMARFFAVLIDHAIILMSLLLGSVMLVILAVSESIFTQGAGLSVFLLFMLFFILQWFYFFLFEWLNRGRTPGKMALGLRVISMDGTALDPVQLLIRNLLRVADMFPLKFLFWIFYLPTYSAGLLSMFFSAPRFRRLGDLAAGTIVIRESGREAEAPIDVGIDSELHRRISFRVFPSATLTQALHDYANRYKNLHPVRRTEIAERVRPGLELITGEVECSAEELLLACHVKLAQREDA